MAYWSDSFEKWILYRYTPSIYRNVHASNVSLAPPHDFVSGSRRPRGFPQKQPQPQQLVTGRVAHSRRRYCTSTLPAALASNRARKPALVFSASPTTVMATSLKSRSTCGVTLSHLITRLPRGQQEGEECWKHSGQLSDISLGMVFWIWLQKQTGGMTKKVEEARNKQEGPPRDGEDICQSYVC